MDFSDNPATSAISFCSLLRSFCALEIYDSRLPISSTILLISPSNPLFSFSYAIILSLRIFSSFFSCPPYFYKSSIFLLTLSLLSCRSLTFAFNDSLSLRTPAVDWSNLNLSFSSSSLSAEYHKLYLANYSVHSWASQFRWLFDPAVQSKYSHHFPSHWFKDSFLLDLPLEHRFNFWAEKWCGERGHETTWNAHQHVPA